MHSALRTSPRSIQALCPAFAIVLFLSTHAFAQTASPSNDVERRADSILSQMTLEEKIDMLGGVDGFFIRDLPRLKLPRLKMADGPIGVRNFGPATAMPGGIALAATWNPALAERVGKEIGRDARAKGAHFLLAPGVNIYRAPMNGRNFEYFGEDPFLASRIAVGYIKGVQSQGVSATVKHFMGNNSEFDRHNSDSVIDERTMREIYLPVFEAAVREAHVGAVMDSYNLTNGEHMSQNKFLNSDVLKKEWGFDGILMSDWDATYDAVAAANAGLDLEMPSGKFLNRKLLLPAVQEGKVSVATIDDKVRRILRKAIALGWLDRDQADYSIPRYNLAGRAAALQGARESIVLLKNQAGLLPLDKNRVKTIALIGPDAYPAVPVGGGSARVQPFAAISFLEGLGNHFGDSTPVYYSRGVPNLADMAAATNFSTAESSGQSGLNAEYFNSPDLQGTPVVTRREQHINFGAGSQHFPDTSLSARWSGFFIPKKPGTYEVFVESTGEDGGSFRLYVDDQMVFDNWSSHTTIAPVAKLSMTAAPHKIVFEQHGRSNWLGGRLRLGIVAHDGLVDSDAKELAAKAGAVVLAVGFDPSSESEGGDRTFSLPPGQDQLINEMAAINKNTIVVITSGGSVDMSSWGDRVGAILQAWYPGQEGGTALAEILRGEVNPSGHLPATFEHKWEENPVHASYYPAPGTKRVEYKEGVFVGYRGYQHNGTKPLFPFGHGLSYTTFSYRNLAVGTPGADGNFTVSFDVTNTGKREGAEVAQVYIGDSHAKVPRPEKELKGFQKESLKPGETRRFTVTLDRRALSYYDVTSKQWRADPGEFNVFVGHSSEQIDLQGKLALGRAVVSQ